MARSPFRNVRELQGALNRILAIQELEGRTVSLEELPELVGEARREVAGEDAGTREDPAERTEPAEPEWAKAVRETAEAAESAGFSAHRLRRLLEGGGGAEAADWRAILRGFRRDVDRLREMSREMDALGDPWPEAAANLLWDPDRIEEAESLLESARERARPFPSIPPGPELARAAAEYPPMAVRAAEQTVSGERPDYSPLFLHTTDARRARRFLESVARTFRARKPEARVGLVPVRDFAEEFIRAVSEGVAGAWRERWWSLDLLILLEAEGLASTERAQEEFFHLFEALARGGSRMIVAADRPPSRLDGVEERLRSRFEGGLVVDLGLAPADALREAEPEGSDPDDVLSELRAFAGVVADEDGDAEEDVGPLAVAGPDGEGEGAGTWRPSPEKVVWNWRRLEDRLSESESER
jgi:chromosomal replication initiator protein